MNMVKKQGARSKYESSFKVAIAHEYLTSELGLPSIGRKYGISASTVKFFVKWYQSKYPGAVNVCQVGAPVQPSTDKALKEANLKIAALEMLIENAGKELGIDLVKKPGTKQSGK